MPGFSKRLKHTTLSTNGSLCWSLWQAGRSTSATNAISLVYRQTEVQDCWVNIYPYTWIFKIYLPLDPKPKPGLSTKTKNTARVCTDGQLLPCSITESTSPRELSAINGTPSSRCFKVFLCQGWGFSSVAECLPSKLQALGFLSTKGKKQTKNILC